MMRFRKVSIVEAMAEFPDWTEWVSQDEDGVFEAWSKEPEKLRAVFDINESRDFHNLETIPELHGFFPDWETSKMTIAEFKEKYGVDDDN